MLDLMVASMTMDRRMREVWSGSGSQPYRDHDATRPVRPSTPERATNWWASRIARLPESAADALPST